MSFALSPVKTSHARLKTWMRPSRSNIITSVGAVSTTLEMKLRSLVRPAIRPSTRVRRSSSSSPVMTRVPIVISHLAIEGPSTDGSQSEELAALTSPGCASSQRTTPYATPIRPTWKAAARLEKKYQT